MSKTESKCKNCGEIHPLNKKGQPMDFAKINLEFSKEKAKMRIEGTTNGITAGIAAAMENSQSFADYVIEAVTMYLDEKKKKKEQKGGKHDIS